MPEVGGGNRNPLRGMILAAGLGKRLRPLTLHCAKPAVPFLNRPLIEYSLDLFLKAGIQEIAVNLHYSRQSVVDVVENYLRRGSPRRTARGFFSHEEKILGTAGALGRQRRFLSQGDFAVCNGKIYFEEDLGRVWNFHRRTGSMVTMVLVPRAAADPHNVVLTDEEGNVTGFAPKDQIQDFGKGYTYTGLQILSPQVLRFIPDEPCDTVRHIYPRLLREGYPIRGFVSHGCWCESSLPSRYLENSMRMLRRRGVKNLLDSDLHGSLENVIAGSKVQVGPGSRLRNVVLWDGARVGSNSSLHNVIITADLEVPAETRATDVVITRSLEGGVPGPVGKRSGKEQSCRLWPLI